MRVVLFFFSLTPGYYVHDSLYIMINDFKGSTGLVIHHIMVRVSTHSLHSGLGWWGGGILTV